MYTPFVNLPSRKLEDYHKLIRHPVSLKLVQKRIRGIHGRATPTGVTDFKTWDAFGQEMSFIWRNAQEYNEDGSEMYNLAEQFKVGDTTLVHCHSAHLLDYRSIFKKCFKKPRTRSRSHPGRS